MNQRIGSTLLASCLAVFLGVGCGPATPPQTTDTGDAPDTTMTDTGVDADPDTAGPDTSIAPDVEEFAFLGIEGVTPSSVPADAPGEVELQLETTGPMPGPDAIGVEIAGESVEIDDQLRLTPPARPGRPGRVDISVTIDTTTHTLRAGLGYAVDLESIDPGRPEPVDLPGVDRVHRAWTVESNGDETPDLLVLQPPAAPVADPSALSGVGHWSLHLLEGGDSGMTAKKSVKFKAGAELSKAANIAAPTGGSPGEATISVSARQPKSGGGTEIVTAEYASGSLTAPTVRHTVDAAHTLVDYEVLRSTDPASGQTKTSTVTVTRASSGAIQISETPDGSSKSRTLAKLFPDHPLARAVDGDRCRADDAQNEHVLVRNETAHPIAGDLLLTWSLEDPATGRCHLHYVDPRKIGSDQGKTRAVAGVEISPDMDTKPTIERRLGDVDGDGLPDLLAAVRGDGSSALFLAPGDLVKTRQGTVFTLQSASLVMKDPPPGMLSEIRSRRDGSGNTEVTMLAATSHNASRSNRSQGLVAPATSHNASRSNRSQGLVAPDDGQDDSRPQRSRYLVPAAFNHNSSRSNRSSYIRLSGGLGSKGATLKGVAAVFDSGAGSPGASAPVETNGVRGLRVFDDGHMRTVSWADPTSSKAPSSPAEQRGIVGLDMATTESHVVVAATVEGNARLVSRDQLDKPDVEQLVERGPISAYLFHCRCDGGRCEPSHDRSGCAAPDARWTRTPLKARPEDRPLGSIDLAVVPSEEESGDCDDVDVTLGTVKGKTYGATRYRLDVCGDAPDAFADDGAVELAVASDDATDGPDFPIFLADGTTTSVCPGDENRVCVRDLPEPDGSAHPVGAGQQTGLLEAAQQEAKGPTLHSYSSRAVGEEMVVVANYETGDGVVQGYIWHRPSAEAEPTVTPVSAADGIESAAVLSLHRTLNPTARSSDDQATPFLFETLVAPLDDEGISGGPESDLDLVRLGDGGAAESTEGPALHVRAASPCPGGVSPCDFPRHIGNLNGRLTVLRDGIDATGGDPYLQAAASAYGLGDAPSSPTVHRALTAGLGGVCSDNETGAPLLLYGDSARFPHVASGR